MKKDAVSDIEIMKTRYQFIISTGFALIETRIWKTGGADRHLK